MGENLEVRRIAAGEGWWVDDVSCHAGPADRPFEEEHAAVSVAAVVSGTFTYRTHQGTSLMAPGSILLGNRGRCFECGHDHGTGDRCIAFHFTAAYFDTIAASVPGVRRADFSRPALPPSAALLPYVVPLTVAHACGAEAVEEIGLDLAAACLAAEVDASPPSAGARPGDARRISEAVRRIEAQAHLLDDERLTLASLARDAGMSRYHFLRTFRALVGVPPHRYVLRTRMARAAARLAATDEPVTDIALGAGFADLSTFCRQFRATMGHGPTAYRRIRRVRSARAGGAAGGIRRAAP